MGPNHKMWNAQQMVLQQALEHTGDHRNAINLFLDHHAMVHSANMAGTQLWSFEDEVVEGLAEADFRFIPNKEDHSIAWVLWHLARIEDVTMNMLVAGSPQILTTNNWLQKMEFNSSETGNALNNFEIAQLSKDINIDKLRAYRLAVGRRTREIAMNLQPGDFEIKVDPSRLEKVLAEGAVVETTRWLTDYWGKKTIAGLLLMPPTRHNFVHLNEAARIKKKI